MGYAEGNSFVGYSWASLGACMDYIHWFFTWSFAATAATILSGSVAERCQLGAYLLVSCLVTGIVHPVCAHWIWSDNGWLAPGRLSPNGFIDTAGSGAIHLCGGVAALVMAGTLGPRYQWSPSDLSGNFTGHSAVLSTIGTFLLWISW